MNSVHMIGRIVNEPELKYTQKQKAVTTIRLAVDAGHADQSGNRQTYFFDVVAWEGTAQFITTWFDKGQMIAISGKLQTRSWTDKHDQKRVNVEIVAQNVYFCGERKTSTVGGEPGFTLASVGSGTGTLPGGESVGGASAEQTRFDYRNDFRPMEDDDDVPF